jgi:multimeric flavodoxin WrbA
MMNHKIRGKGGMSMKTLFDLRVRKDEEIYEAIQNLYKEPLKVVGFDDREIGACTGCWSCWVKTPGKCVRKDRMAEIYPDYVGSDTVILLMDTAQGFISEQAKAFIDRTIPHFHPYIVIEDGECHHMARYKRYPDMTFYYDKDGLTSQEDQVIEDYLYRTAYQFKSHGYRVVNDGGLKLLRLESRPPKNRSLEFASTAPMEKLVIYNGSPRRRGSNSAIILNRTAELLGDKVEIRDLNERNKWDEWAEAFRNEKDVMFFMPLYVHAMPSHVKAFIEKLQVSEGTISFFVQSGFPESSQSHYLEAYFELLASRLGRRYLGTAIKGGVEGFQTRPEKSRMNIVDSMANTMVSLVRDGKFNPKEVGQLAIPVRFGKGIQFIFKLISKLSTVINSFWDQQLKANDAYEKRFDRPYLPSAADGEKSGSGTLSES